MGILSWIVLGLLVGVVARTLMPGDDSLGLIFTTLLGIGGAIVGGYVGTQFGYGSVSGFDLRSVAIATCGAVALLLARRAFTTRGLA
ncbi:MAG: GlsB/YeaQ/YmgE family stress response membrane protein [Lacipirellulaceae bacterium]